MTAGIGAAVHVPNRNIGSEAAAAPPPRVRGQASYLVIETRAGGVWRDHAYLPIAKTEQALHATRELRDEPGVDEVRLNVEIITGDGRLVRHPLFLAPGQAAVARDRSLLSGYSQRQWDLFLGNWLEQTADDDEVDGEAELKQDWREKRKAERMLLRRGMRPVKKVLAFVPLVLVVLYVGLFTDVVALDFSAAAQPAPAFAGNRIVQPPAVQRREAPRPAAIPSSALRELDALARPLGS